MPVFGVVLGGLEPRLRQRSAEETAKRAVAGFVLGGFGMGESAALRAALVRESVLPQLPPLLPRLLMGVGAPADVVALVGSGVDAFSAAYPLTLTQSGYASTFDIPGVDRGAAKAVWRRRQQQQKREPKRARVGGRATTEGSMAVLGVPVATTPAAGTNGKDDDDAIVDASAATMHGKVQLRDRRWMRDARPLLPGCSCATCRCYTRAYVTHLLNCNEMLASTLLYHHNLHHYLLFFEQMRVHIETGQFKRFARHFGVDDIGAGGVIT